MTGKGVPWSPERWARFERECDEAYALGKAMEAEDERRRLTGVPAEQADWDGGDGSLSDTDDE